MLETLSIVAMSILAAYVLCLIIWFWRFVRMYSFAERPSRRTLLSFDDPPSRAVVLLAVRGADPSLIHCLHGLLRQNHPAYDIVIIFDSREDPAWDLICSHAAMTSGRVLLHVLTKPRQTCSLKMSALLDVIAQLDGSYGVVALIDADVIPHESWLSDLVRPLGEDNVGASTGIRWYSPCSAEWGTLVRYLWNAAASVHMVNLQIPWGGSMAFRVDALRRSDLLGKWSVSLFEDAGCHDSLRKIGLRVQVVPEATMVNRETIDLKGCFNFIRRQLLDARLYHSSWGTVLMLGLLFTVAAASAAALMVAALVIGNIEVAGWLTIGLTIYAMVMLMLLLFFEMRLKKWHQHSVKNIETMGPASRTVCCTPEEPSSDPADRPSIWFWLRALIALPLTHAIYLVCLLSSLFVRQIVWRGIAYHLDGPFSVRLLQYVPYSPDVNTDMRTSVT